MFPSLPGPQATDPRIAALIRRQGGRGEALIEVMHQVQELLGHLPPTALRQVASGLELPLSHVFGVASFYHLFHLEPPTARCCAVCLGTACFVRGGMELVARLESRLGVRLDHPHSGDTWVLRGISCLGACGLGPLLLVDGVLAPGLPLASPDLLEARFEALGLPPHRQVQP